MPGAVARTSTIALTNATLRYGLEIANKGLESAVSQSDVIASGVNCYDGKVCCKNLADSFADCEYVDVRELV
jgi:alanine dehydrogenase